MNPLMMLGNVMKSGGNPQNIVMNMLQNTQNNPMAGNVLQMIQNNDMQGIENMARNMCEANGTTPEQAIAQAKRMFGIK